MPRVTAPWSIVERLVSVGASYIFLLGLARYLGPQEFGVIALSTVPVLLLSATVDVGLIRAIIQSMPSKPELNRFWVFASAVTAVIVWAVLWLGGGAFSNLFSEPQVGPLVRWTAPAAFFAILSSPFSAYFQANGSFRDLSHRRILSSLVATVCGSLAILFGFSAYSLASYYVSYHLLGLIFLITRTLRLNVLVTYRQVSFEDVRGAGATTATAALAAMSRNVDDLVVAGFLGTVSYSHYNLGYRAMSGVLDTVTSGYANGFIARALPLRDNLNSLQSAYTQGLKNSLRLTGFMLVLAYIAAPFAIPIVLGDSWSPSIPVLQAMVCLGYLLALTSLNPVVLLLRGENAWMLGTQASALVLTLGGVWFGSRFGLHGAVAGLIVGNLLALVPRLIALHATLGVSPLLPLQVSGVRTAGFAAMLLAIPLNSFASIPVATLVGAGVAVPWIVDGSRLFKREFLHRPF